MSRTIALLLGFGLLAIPTISLAQEPLLGNGLPPFDTVSNGVVDKVDAGSLNVHVSIPALQKVGRGMPFNYVFNYDSTVWSLNSAGTAWQPAANWGWRGVSEAILGYVSYTHYANQPCTGYPNITVYENFAYHDPSGTTHSFYYYSSGAIFAGLGSPACPNEGYVAQATLVAVDGSGYTITVNNNPSVVSLYDRSGKLIALPLIDVTNGQPTSTNGAGSITDTNGNVISTNGSKFYDTMSATAPVLTVSGTNPVKYTYTGPNNTSPYVAVNYQNFTVATNFGCTGYTEYAAKVVPLITSIVLADGSSYGFKYEKTLNQSGHYTGRISEVDLPTGGTIQYTYQMICPDAYDPPMNGEVTRTLTPGGVWTYQVLSVGNSGTPGRNAVVDPAGNETDLSFITGGSDPYWHPYESYRQVYQGSSSTGTLLETITTCYNSGNVPSWSECHNETQITLPVVQIDSFRTPAGGGNAQSETLYTNYGLLTEDQEYDYGGTFISDKKIAYASPNSNILDRPACVQVTAGAGPATCGTVTSNTASLMNYSNYDSYGNVQTISYWVSGSSYLSRHFTYYSTGLVKTMADVNGSQGTYTYTYGDCNGSLPTTISEPVNLSVSMTWDCNGGVLLNYTSESGYPESWGYTDPRWRATSFTDPGGNTVGTAYSVNSVTATQNFNGGTLENITTLDGLGRGVNAQVYNGSGYDTVQTTYDALGRVNFVSSPFSCSTVGGCSSSTGTTTTYDAAGRVHTVTDANSGVTTNTYSAGANGSDVMSALTPVPSGDHGTQRARILQYDGLGRLTSVCEVNTFLDAAACGQAITGTGYLTSYKYDALGNMIRVTQGVQTRTFTFDGLSRMLSEINPETGTTTYMYDYKTTQCGTNFLGDLVEVYHNNGGYVCFGYDGLHRKVIGAHGGTNASLTDDINFAWDSATVNGIAVGQKGKMAEAWTCPPQIGSGCSSHKTDEGFTYDKRGNPYEYFQMSPNSGGWYGVAETYDAIGNLAALSLPSVPELTVSGYDAEGRPNGMTAASGVSPVASAVNYGYFGALSVTYGSGDHDTFGYDNLGHMTGYKTWLSSSYYLGTLSWNPNGTLGSLRTTDNIPGNGGGNCCGTVVNYQYDDVGRLWTAVGGALSQTFTYDRYGNLSTNGNPYSWNPPCGYNTAGNNYVQGGSCGISYDADGNILNDTFYTYTWNTDNKMVSANSNAIIYDALDRVVETAVGEHLYAPSMGDIVQMNGQTLGIAVIPLPGSGSVLYNNTGVVGYSHFDWHGNSRLSTTQAGGLLQQSEYSPFGQQYDNTSTTYVKATIFDGGYIQTLSNVFDMPNRNLHSIQGRWIQPDPAGLAAVDPSNPQSWNRYAYATNNPTSNTDPTGLCDDGSGDDGSGACGGDGSGGDGGGSDPGGTMPSEPVTSEPVGSTTEPSPGDCGGLCGVSGGGSTSGPDSFGIVSPTNDLGPGNVVGMDLSYNASWTGFGAQGSSGNFWDFCGNSCTSALGWASNFSAGAGDALTFGLTSVVNHITGAGALINRKSGAYWAGFGTGTAVGIAAGPKAPWFGYKGIYNGRSPIAPLLRVGFGQKQGVGLVFRVASGGTLWKTGLELPWWEHWLDIPMNGAARVMGW